jgi:hypothetical protein
VMSWSGAATLSHQLLFERRLADTTAIGAAAAGAALIALLWRLQIRGLLDRSKKEDGPGGDPRASLK